MAKILFVPNWLREDVYASGQSLCVLEKELSTTILSKVDIINYHLAQIEFFKFITGGKDFGEDVYLMYNSLFTHPLPAMPEIDVHMKRYLVGGSADTDAKIAYIVDKQSEGDSIYIIGTDASNDIDDVQTNRYNVITEILAVMHNRLRLQNGAVDKSSAFRDLPLLTTLYVECIPC